MMTADIPQRGFAFVSQPDLSEQVALVERLESMGYCSIFVVESRMMREAFSSLGALAIATERVKLGAVINAYTRNPALVAMSLATLDEIAPGRVDLTVTSYWDRIAAKQGVKRGNVEVHLRAYVESIRQLLAMDRVTLSVPTFELKDVALDLGLSGDWTPVDVDISLLASSRKIADLAVDLDCNLIINGLTSTNSTAAIIGDLPSTPSDRRAIKVKGPLVNVSLSEDSDEALVAAKRFLATYFGQQPHFARLNSLDPDLVNRLEDVVGHWPSSAERIGAGSSLISSELVHRFMVAGTPRECSVGLEPWIAAGANFPIIVPVHGDTITIAQCFAPFA